MADETIAPELLATFRRCTFARRTFAASASPRARSPMEPDELPTDAPGGDWFASARHDGEPFDSDL